jgi:hypothetical protein
MIGQEELKARIEHVENTLKFYVLYEKDLVKGGCPTEELERLINRQLDTLSELYKLKE